MTSDEDKYCHLSDLQKDQCSHCLYALNTLGPIDGGLYLEEYEDNATE